MSIWNRDYARAEVIEQTNSFAQRVYGWMTLGLLTTALVAFGVVKSGLVMALLPYWWLTALGTLGIAMAINGMMHRIQFSTMATLFLVYSGLQGVFFGTFLPLYAAAFGGEVVWLAFLTAGVVYGLAMLYSLFTKTDLTRFSRILSIALIGLMGITILYVILSLFMPLSGGTLLISYIGLIIFTGLTAVDAQQIRNIALQIQDNSTAAQKLSLMMALKMYINVIMIFWYLLQILSSRRR